MNKGSEKKLDKTAQRGVRNTHVGFPESELGGYGRTTRKGGLQNLYSEVGLSTRLTSCGRKSDCGLGK